MVRFLQLRAAASDSVLLGADPTSFETSNPIRLFIIQAAIIIIVTRVLGLLLQKIKQPRVIAEVIGGILLGPTAMGRVPGFSQHIFPNPSLPYLNLVSTLGLVLFLFLVGLEVDTRIVRKCVKESCAISLVGIVLPFGLGAAVSVGIYNTFIDAEKVSFGHFVLFTGVAMSITAFPVLARILTETKLLYTKVGVIVLAAGVGNDVVGWILLALTVALVNAGSGVTAVYVLLCCVAWVLVLFFLIKPAFVWLARRSDSHDNGPSQVMIMITLLLVLVSAWITDIIGVHPIFGSFLVGLMIPHEGGYAIALTEKMEDLVSVIFLPIYFALSGLKTNLGDLNSGIAWAYTIAIIFIAFFSKFIGCAGTAKLFGMDLRESAAIGMLMSCKGLVELIVLNIGLNAGILDTRVFSMFVLMAIVSTVITTPLTLWVYPESHRTMMDEPARGQHHGKRGEETVDTDSALLPKHLLVVLSSFEHLPGLMTLVQLMQPTLAASVSTASSGLRQRYPESVDHSVNSMKEASTSMEGPHVTTLASSGPTADISIEALRLIELTDRTSAVMKVSESEDTMRADAMLNVFRTFAGLNGLPVQSSMAVILQDEFANTVTRRCKAAGCNFIVLPMTLPRHTGINGESTRDSGMAPSSPLPTSISSPFESLFGASRSEGFRSNQQHFHVVRRIMQTAESDVGILIERRSGDISETRAGALSILLGFMGGPDDRAALDLVSRMCASNTSLTVLVVHLTRGNSASDESSNDPLPNMPSIQNELTIRSMQNNNMDTIYPTQAGGAVSSPLEAMLADDMALQQLQDQMATNRFGGRLTISPITTARPLTELISQVEQHRPAMVVVGRGRRDPAQTHRAELKSLISTHNSHEAVDRQLNSELTKVVGEPCTALSFAESHATTLVIAAGWRLPHN